MYFARLQFDVIGAEIPQSACTLFVPGSCERRRTFTVAVEREQTSRDISPLWHITRGKCSYVCKLVMCTFADYFCLTRSNIRCRLLWTDRRRTSLESETRLMEVRKSRLFNTLDIKWRCIDSKVRSSDWTGLVTVLCPLLDAALILYDTCVTFAPSSTDLKHGLTQLTRQPKQPFICAPASRLVFTAPGWTA